MYGFVLHGISNFSERLYTQRNNLSKLEQVNNFISFFANISEFVFRYSVNSRQLYHGIKHEFLKFMIIFL